MSNEIKKEEMDKKFKGIQIWIQKQNILPEDMPNKMIRQRRLLKSSIDLLNDENRLDKSKGKILKLKKKNKYKSSASTKIIDGISPSAKNILLKIGKNFEMIENSITDITKMNALYLEKNMKNTFMLEKMRNKTLSKFNFKNFKNGPLDDLLNNTNNEKSYNLLEKTPLNKITINNNNKNRRRSQLKKKDYINNFMYVNDNYRKQLNCAFLKYNPISHLENMKILVQADSSIRNDIMKIKEEVEEDIKIKCDKFHFKKQYLNILSKSPNQINTPLTPTNNPKIIERNNLLNKPAFKKEIKSEIALPNLSHNKKDSTTPNYTKIKASKYFERIKPKNSKYNLIKDQKIEEIKYMLNATEEISNLIHEKNIKEKIDLYRTNYGKKYFETKDDEKLDKDYFSNDKNKVIYKISDIYRYKLSKNILDKEKQLNDKIVNENLRVTKKIIDGKKNAIEELKKYINSNHLE